jgi:hypothetical protein
MEKTRWYLFSKKQQQDSAFSPTKSTLYFHIQRAHYQAEIWKKSTKPIMQLDDPCDAGWKIIGNKHQTSCEKIPKKARAPSPLPKGEYCNVNEMPDQLLRSLRLKKGQTEQRQIWKRKTYKKKTFQQDYKWVLHLPRNGDIKLKKETIVILDFFCGDLDADSGESTDLDSTQTPLDADSDIDSTRTTLDPDADLDITQTSLENFGQHCPKCNKINWCQLVWSCDGEETWNSNHFA